MAEAAGRGHSTATMADVVATLTNALTVRPRTTLEPADKTRAAVLVPLLPVDGAPHLLFTRRAHHLPHHRGEVSFPGGRLHPEDGTDLARTALRESQEEIGLDPADVTVLGALDDVETRASRFVITPFVGVVPYPYEWRPSPDEVDAIFTVPLAVLSAPATETSEMWDFGGRTIPIHAYRIGGQVIWGATHRITRSLLAALGIALPPAQRTTD